MKLALTGKYATAEIELHRESGMRQHTLTPSVTQSIVEDLGTGIVTGRFDTGVFPTEIALCEHYEAARTVVREAVKMLISKGLIASRRKQGIRVQLEQNWNLLDPDVLRWLLERKYSPKLLLEFTQMRLSVEPSAAALAAQSATDDDKHRIRQAIDRMYAAEQGDDDPLSADIAFHVAVIEASDNRFYMQIREMIATALQISIRRTNQIKGVHYPSAKDHDKVAHAIASGDSEAAYQNMYNLIEGALDLIQKDLAKT